VPCVQVNVWLSAAESATVAQAGYDVIHRYRARPPPRPLLACDVWYLCQQPALWHRPLSPQKVHRNRCEGYSRIASRCVHVLCQPAPWHRSSPPQSANIDCGEGIRHTHFMHVSSSRVAKGSVFARTLGVGFRWLVLCRSFGWYLDQQIPNPAATNYFWRTCVSTCTQSVSRTQSVQLVSCFVLKAVCISCKQ
jgi:hypothetical protein